ncbi:hypothetical protein J6590_093117 [Homalodisca vitripennis]|nr:hypothetical protein J6590_093117 [Homalodisca vitripennis]
MLRKRCASCGKEQRSSAEELPTEVHSNREKFGILTRRFDNTIIFIRLKAPLLNSPRGRKYYIHAPLVASNKNRMDTSTSCEAGRRGGRRRYGGSHRCSRNDTSGRATYFRRGDVTGPRNHSSVKSRFNRTV